MHLKVKPVSNITKVTIEHPGIDKPIVIKLKDATIDLKNELFRHYANTEFLGKSLQPDSIIGRSVFVQGKPVREEEDNKEVSEVQKN
jgi:hypothetical protein